jgi:hypothetical protein
VNERLKTVFKFFNLGPYIFLEMPESSLERNKNFFLAKTPPTDTFSFFYLYFYVIKCYHVSRVREVKSFDLQIKKVYK